MVKATKTTLKTLQGWKNDKYAKTACILAKTIRYANAVEELLAEGAALTADDYRYGYYTEDSLYYKAPSYEAGYFSGMYTQWPELIGFTRFLNGVNEVVIPDINKLVKKMVSEVRSGA